AMADMFGHPDNAEGFVLKPHVDIEPATRKRHYSTPESGTWWHEAQDFVGEDGVVAAIILYSDVTHLSENGHKLAWPVMMTLGNIKQGKHWASAGHCLLRTLPIPPSNMTSEQKTQLFQRAALTMLQGLLDGRERYRGFFLTDPNDVKHVVKPLLYAWVLDYPESGKVTCTLSGSTSRPCSICYAQKVSVTIVFIPPPVTICFLSRVLQNLHVTLKPVVMHVTSLLTYFTMRCISPLPSTPHTECSSCILGTSRLCLCSEHAEDTRPAALDCRTCRGQVGHKERCCSSVLDVCIRLCSVAVGSPWCSMGEPVSGHHAIHYAPVRPRDSPPHRGRYSSFTQWKSRNVRWAAGADSRGDPDDQHPVPSTRVLLIRGSSGSTRAPSKAN
ncbi:unnamed protein product, partial [Closterium sp. NIES-53]